MYLKILLLYVIFFKNLIIIFYIKTSFIISFSSKITFTYFNL